MNFPLNSVLLILCGFSILSHAYLSKEEWALINPALPLLSEENLETLVANYGTLRDKNLLIHVRPEERYFGFIPTVDPQSQNSIREFYQRQLESEYKDLIENKAPFWRAARNDLPVQSFRLLSNYYRKDINDENPWSRFENEPYVDSALKLLQLPPEIGLRFSKDDQKALLRNFLRHSFILPAEQRGEEKIVPLLNAILDDPRTPIDESDKDWLMQIIFDRFKHDKTWLGTFEVIAVQGSNMMLQFFVRIIIHHPRLRVNRFDIVRLTRECDFLSQAVLFSHPLFDPEIVRTERRFDLMPRFSLAVATTLDQMVRAPEPTPENPEGSTNAENPLIAPVSPIQRRQLHQQEDLTSTFVFPSRFGFKEHQE